MRVAGTCMLAAFMHRILFSVTWFLAPAYICHPLLLWTVVGSWDEMRWEYPLSKFEVLSKIFFRQTVFFFEFEFGLSLGSNVAWVWVRLTRPLVVSTVTPPTAIRLCWLSFWAAMFPSQWEACQQKYLHTITVQVSCCVWADRWTIIPMLVAYVPKTSESPRDWLSKIFFWRSIAHPGSQFMQQGIGEGSVSSHSHSLIFYGIHIVSKDLVNINFVDC